MPAPNDPSSGPLDNDFSQAETGADAPTKTGADAPTAKVPKAEGLHPEIPQTDALQTNAPQTDALQTDAPQTDAPQTDVFPRKNWRHDQITKLRPGMDLKNARFLQAQPYLEPQPSFVPDLDPYQERQVLIDPRASVPRNIKAIGKYYRALFGTEDWGEHMTQRVPYRPGPMTKEERILGIRRLADPEARFYYSVMMSEIVLLPMYLAYNANERDMSNREIASILGLDICVERGWITSYVICWEQCRFPKFPTQVRIFPARDRNTRAKALGELEPRLRELIDQIRNRPKTKRRTPPLGYYPGTDSTDEIS